MDTSSPPMRICRDVIVIGGSTGAVAPLQSLLARLPADLPAAVLIVLHIPARGTGMLSTMAAAAGPLPVLEARDGMPVGRGHVYVAGPDRHLMVEDGRILLGHGPHENMSRPAIDALFRSAAICFGPRVIGVVLSGLLSDGAAGLDAIKRCGGVALVQDPTDATADEMPRRALEAADVDLCVPSARLADALVGLVAEAPGEAPPVPDDLRLEVETAAGYRVDQDRLARATEPVAFTCPACGGVLSRVRTGRPLRFRCQLGHAYTAEALADAQEIRVDHALRVALRIVEERAALVARMADEGRQNGRTAVAAMYDARASAYRIHADVIRDAVLRSHAGDRRKRED